MPLFGGSKSSGPPPNLDETSKRLGDRQEAVQKKAKQIEIELTKLRDQIRKTPNKMMQERLKQKAMQLLRQKKLYEKQLESLMGQQFNVDQTNFTLNQVKDSVDTVNAMKFAAKTMKKQFKEVNIDKVEDLYDDMLDVMDDANDLQDVLSRSYDVPEDLDDTELMAELDVLEGEMQTEDDSYLDVDLEVPTKSLGSSSTTKTSISRKSKEDEDLERELGLV
ncbi:hypothetical protein ABK040_002686 [Willaertia magna]